jgi:hypothetical protein
MSEMSMRSTDIKSRISDIESFLVSKIWEDIKSEVTLWRENLRDLLQREEGNSLYRCQGRAEACEYFLELPDVFLQELKMLEEERKIKDGT